MPGPEFFSRFGLFCEAGFLDSDACAQLRAEVAAARTVPGAVAAGAGDQRVDVKSRRTAIAEIAPDARARVDERLDEIAPRIEAHFGFEATAREPLQFLVYGEGDFFEAHSDRNPSPGGQTASSRWRVSVVIFLSGESDRPAEGSHGGGSLTFYGLLGDSAHEGAEGRPQVGLPLEAREGLLVAFPSETTHAVTPITHGERFTVVTWFS